MPNSLTATGLTVNTTTEIVDNLKAAFVSIYGPDINVGPNSPDGQLIGILAQAIQDNLQLLVQVYNSFSVTSAFGTILDQRVSISGIARNQGTYTKAFVSVTTSTALSLPGQDVLLLNPSAQVFTVSDLAGNQFQLIESFAFGGPGTASLAFSAVTLGQIQTVPNTIQTVVTVVPGVTSVNNPSTDDDVEGLPEETDPQLKIHQAKSYFLQAQAPADAIRAALLQVPGCADSYVAENDTGSTADGVPAHGIWVIVNGGAAVDVATAIYKKKNPGCAMVGAQSYAVVRPQGNTATVYWDNAVAESLYLRATLYPKIAGQQFDVTADGVALANTLIYKLGQSSIAGDIATAMAIIEPLAVVGNAQVSTDGSTWEQIVTPSDFSRYFLTSSSKISLSNA